MNNLFELKILPDKYDLATIKQWLYEEYLSLNCLSGFYCNWDMIETGFEKHRLLVYSLKNKPIGFVLWHEFEECISIDIMAIAQPLRGLGIGKALVEILYIYFRKKNAFALKLFCAPKSSVSFWKGKMKFIQFPNRGYSESEFTFYKLLINTNLSVTKPNSQNKLELWDDEPYMINIKKPKWSWNIDDDLRYNPIIHPCNYNWNLRLTRNGEIIKDDKIKYFSNKSIEKGDFLYINSLEF